MGASLIFLKNFVIILLENKKEGVYMLFNPMQPNGFTMYVMQSGEYRDKIIESANRFMRQGIPANMAVKQAMNWERIDESDLTDSDINYINDFIKENM
jgi:uncharacterized protein with von Willebrand factor type A (vWA) domain